MQDINPLASGFVRKSFGGNTQTKYTEKLAQKNFARRPVSQSGKYAQKLKGQIRSSKRATVIKDPNFYRYREDQLVKPIELDNPRPFSSPQPEFYQVTNHIQNLNINSADQLKILGIAAPGSPSQSFKLEDSPDNLM